jgi:PTS system glucitol/sorbitol-specific IIA component
MSVVYSTTVTQVGAQVETFLDHGLLIFFKSGSPEELHDMSVLHDVATAEDGPRPGDTLLLGRTELEVLAVGNVVRDNLLNLGHMDIKADGRTEAKLPGDVCVRVGDLPLLRTGDPVSITRPAAADPTLDSPTSKDSH